MKWFWNHCRRREETSLLAAGSLSGDEQIATERHLAGCAECRAYYDSLNELASPLVEWEKSFSSVEATPAMRARWAKAVLQKPGTPADVSRSSTWDTGIVRTVWRQLIWPSRYAWSGLAALWVVMLAANTQLSERSTTTTPTSSQQILQSWKEQNRVFAEWDRPDLIAPAAPMVPAHAPRPRSQTDRNWAVI